MCGKYKFLLIGFISTLVVKSCLLDLISFLDCFFLEWLREVIELEFLVFMAEIGCWMCFMVLLNTGNGPLIDNLEVKSEAFKSKNW